jgi:hypothetical protein
MKRGLSDYEYEIVNQILIIELCFDACKEVPIKAGMGDHFNCYFFNLNMSKGIASLQSLLDPTKGEISLKNYISEHGSSISKRDNYSDFIKEIALIQNNFTATVSNMRHKVISHLDSGYKHSDFTSAYLLSDKLDGLIKITFGLKEVFFKFCNWAQDNAHDKILRKVKSVIKNIDK